MTEAEKAAEEAICPDSPMTAHEAFLAGAAWQREQDAKLVEQTSLAAFPSVFAAAIRAQDAKQECPHNGSADDCSKGCFDARENKDV